MAEPQFPILVEQKQLHPHENFSAARELEARLRSTVRGEVRFDAASRALYATDSSNYRQVPIGLVLPRDTADVVATVAACREFDAAVLSRGGGTSVAGQTCNVAVVLDFSKYMHASSRSIPRPPRPRRARHRPRRPPQRGRAARAYLRPRPRNPQPLHPRRHDRQQLLRRPRADGRQDRR